MRIMLKSKIHRSHVTQLNLDYEGSITIDQRLLEEADILPYEQVEVLNINNGARLTTYAIKGERGSGEIGINGPAARLAAKGDQVIILSYCYLEDAEAHNSMPKVIHVNAQNAITETKQAIDAMPF